MKHVTIAPIAMERSRTSESRGMFHFTEYSHEYDGYKEDFSTICRFNGPNDVISNDKVDAFLTWLRTNGAAFPNIQWPGRVMNDTEDEEVSSGKDSEKKPTCDSRGAIAMEDIRNNDASMLQIPAKCIIFEEECFKHPVLRRVYEEQRDLFLRDEPTLALFLMFERRRGTKSFFHPYFDILPYPETLSEWDEMRYWPELQDPPLVEITQRRKAIVRRYYKRIMDCLVEKYPEWFSYAIYPFESFLFAWNTVQARSFGRRLHCSALVPFADCLNHSNVRIKYDFNAIREGYFCMYYTEESDVVISRGAEVFNSYGRHPNRHLLLDYGFSLESNEWDVVEVSSLWLLQESLTMEELHEKTHRKALIEKRMKTWRRWFRKSIKLEREVILEDLIVFARCFVLRTDVLEDEERSAELDLKQMFSIENETAALELIIKALQSKLNKFGTTLEADLELRSERSDWKKLMCLNYRINQKEILTNQIALFRERLSSLPCM